jgi:hypothetical protein
MSLTPLFGAQFVTWCRYFGDMVIDCTSRARFGALRSRMFPLSYFGFRLEGGVH